MLHKFLIAYLFLYFLKAEADVTKSNEKLSWMPFNSPAQNQSLEVKLPKLKYNEEICTY